MATSMNRVWLLGSVSQYGFSLRYVGSTQCASGTIVITDRGKDHKEWSQYLPVDVWGTKAEAASELAPGTVCVCEGKLVRKKGRDDKWELAVSTYALEPVAALPLRQVPGQAPAHTAVAVNDEDIPF